MQLHRVYLFSVLLSSFRLAHPSLAAASVLKYDRAKRESAGAAKAFNAEIYEWTAMGDSYAAGIGAGAEYPRYGLRDKCFRFNQSYPQLLQQQSLIPKPQILNFEACCGNTFQEIIDNQLNPREKGSYRESFEVVKRSPLTTL